MTLEKRWENKMNKCKVCGKPNESMVIVSDCHSWTCGECSEEKMKYFEFKNHEYWALVASANIDEAFEAYVEEVAYSNIEEAKEDGEPVEITRDEALKRYIKASVEISGMTEEELTEEFNSRKNTTLLIDSSLA